MKSQNEFLEGTFGVVLIDMQEGFIENDQEKRNLVVAQVEVSNFCRAQDIPVFVVTYINYGVIEPRLQSELDQFPAGLVEYTVKYSNSAFSHRYFHSKLQERRIDTLFLMGINAGFCVHRTASDAKAHGYQVMTAENVIAGYVGDVHTNCFGVWWYQQNTMCYPSHEFIMAQ